jgi:hypothetical protein
MRIYSFCCFADGQVTIAQDKYDTVYDTKVLVEHTKWRLEAKENLLYFSRKLRTD